MTAVTSRAPIQHAISLAPPARVMQMVSVQTSALQVVLTSTIRQQLKQEGRGMQISNVFPALSSPRQVNACYFFKLMFSLS